MSKFLYKKTRKKNYRIIFRFFSFLVFFIGLCVILYVVYPFISWQIFFASDFEGNNITAPIPKSKVINSLTIKSLLSTSTDTLKGIDYTNAQTWFPGYTPLGKANNTVNSYKITIPKLNIHSAVVSTIDTDLGLHLVNYPGTAIPPGKGNAVIFGHSTLPQLFNPNDYKTIFANAYQLKVDDQIKIIIDDITYFYKIVNITVVSPDDTSVFSQNYDDSYLTLVTCTPPGTTWKRLIIKSRIEKI
jgi:sortase A